MGNRGVFVSAASNPFDEGWLSQKTVSESLRDFKQRAGSSCVVEVTSWGYEVLGAWGRMSYRPNAYKCLVLGRSHRNDVLSSDVVVSTILPVVDDGGSDDGYAGDGGDCSVEEVCHTNHECHKEKVWKLTCWVDKHHKEKRKTI